MKVYLRDQTNQLYCAGLDHWVPDRDKATDFGSVETAQQFARVNEWRNMEVLIRYRQPAQEFALPLSSESPG
jgi:hypothetical protein